MTLGASALSDAELVAIHLGTGRTGQNVLGLAQSLLDAFEGVGGLSCAGFEDLVRVPGLGPAKATRLVAAFALADRAGTARQGERVQLRSSGDVARVAAPWLRRERAERVVLVLTDQRNCVLSVRPVATGGQGSCAVPIREVVATALRCDAGGIALAHNHPSGDPTPSTADVKTSRAVRRACETVGLRWLGHVVLAGTRWEAAVPSPGGDHAPATDRRGPHRVS
ncbi:hypothetical protein AXF14_05950 [Actinomyces radicidentis]|uniref:MPN domain-containing protein n=2 Tax=Actinomyces radicidentis TaxID=111015 RepID=A0A0X8JER1_ACTRD|nr:hypothetical protein AXF14_05950 [Actinomyces radicidentis]